MEKVRSAALARAPGGVMRGVAARLHLDKAAAFWLAELDATWSLGERRARVERVIDEAPDVKTFVLAPGGAWQEHRAGQHVTVEVEVDGARVRRCYSLSSAPSDPRPAITVKRVEGGRVSDWMHRRLRPGGVVGLGAPRGDFTLPEVTPPKVLLLSGGSGATPVMSMLRALAGGGALGDVVYAHCARSRADVIFATELRGARGPAREAPRGAPPGGAPGRAGTPRAGARPRRARGTFLCGPSGMMAVAERVWEGAGRHASAPSRTLQRPAPDGGGREGAAQLARPPGAPSTPTRRGYAPRGARARRERPAYGCRMGICNTCRCRKRSGTVVDAVTGAVSSEPDEDIRLCVSVARGDLELAL